MIDKVNTLLINCIANGSYFIQTMSWQTQGQSAL